MIPENNIEDMNVDQLQADEFSSAEFEEPKKFSFKAKEIKSLQPLKAEVLNQLTTLEIKQLLLDFEYHQCVLEAKKENSLEKHNVFGTELDSNWLGRISYRIAFCKKQRGILERLLGSKKAERYDRAYVDIAKITLDEEDHYRIHARALLLCEKFREESENSKLN